MYSPFFGEEFQFEVPRKFRYLGIYVYDRDRHLKQDKILGKVAIKREENYWRKCETKIGKGNGKRSNKRQVKHQIWARIWAKKNTEAADPYFSPDFRGEKTTTNH